MTWENRLKELQNGPLRFFLWLLSLLYGAIIFLRNAAYDLKLFKTYRLSVPVISVGNIAVGAMGKTPLVRWLAEDISKTKKVAILSRGYRSQSEHNILRVTALTPATLCGDEPLWLAQKLPSVAVWVGKDRVKTGEQAIAEGAEIIILDDGLQHRRLCRDIEIILVGPPEKYFLPRGWLRDSPRRLKKADLLAGREGLQFELRLKADLQGKKVALFCAIGRPERFIESVRQAGATIVATLLKDDHRSFITEELQKFSLQNPGTLLVCTEKDAVKIPSEVKSSLGIQELPAEIFIISGQEKWKKIYDQRIQSHPS
ncbi:MAG: tetraacyldisaccharide 4'-kinase [Verrucomicrobia bacterium]|nr:tetraacyldisaccharide 4'-kinase [Verrucomicrobiota bacterium]